MASSRASLHPPRSEEEIALAKLFEAAPKDKARVAAFEEFERNGLPHRRIEGWRWSDVRAALRGIGDARGEGAFRGDPFKAFGGAEFGFGDMGSTLPPETDGIRRSKSMTPPYFGEAPLAPLAALAVALADVPPVVEIEISKSRAGPVRLNFVTGSTGVFRHIVIRVRAGVEAEVIETYDALRAFTNVALEYRVETGAKLSRTIFQAGTAHAVQTVTAFVQLAQDARLEQTALALGAKLARLETRVEHQEGGSHAELNGAYLVGGGHHADFTSEVRHAAAHCTTRQTVKGVARAGGKGVFQGKFAVTVGAQKTDADMQHQALLLEDGAEVNAKPELVIYADDVACAHGNTIGALDEAALFYIRQRGVPLEEARAMLIEGFIAEAFAAADPKVADILMQEARRWLLAPVRSVGA
jgi:Fe-S cluster assembly protein SufD